jgi:hypothetical protein
MAMVGSGRRWLEKQLALLRLVPEDGIIQLIDDINNEEGFFGFNNPR